MTRAFFSLVAGAGLLLGALSATAQDRDEPFHNDRNAYFHGEHWHARLFERVKEDVEHVRSSTWPRGGDDFRLDRTIHELDELQGKMASGAYDERELGHVIETLGRVASYNRMDQRERDIINDDVNRLREYRDHHADWDRH